MAQIILWSSYAEYLCPARTAACYQLGSWLRQHGFTVKVIEFCHLLTTDELVVLTEKYIDETTIAIGVSSSFWFVPADITSSEPRWVKNARIRITHPVKWLIGGSATDFLTQPDFEWVKFNGFAEDEILQWMRQSVKRVFLPDLKFDIFNQQRTFEANDLIKSTEALPIELGRGCKFKCRFCYFPLIGKKSGTYHRDYRLIKEEFIENYERWGTTKYIFLDDTVNESMEKVTNLAQIAQSLPFELQWVGYNRLDLIGTQPGMSRALQDSGLISTFFGIESFNQPSASAVGKGWNGKHAKDYLLKLRREWGEDITWSLGFIVGLPGDTPAEINKTLEWCIDNDMHDWYFEALAISSREKIWQSEFEKNAETYGYVFPDKINAPRYWNNGAWTFGNAQKFASEMRLKSTPYLKLGVFSIMMISALGYSVDELKKQKRVDINQDVLKEQTRQYAKDYFEKSVLVR